MTTPPDSSTSGVPGVKSPTPINGDRMGSTNQKVVTLKKSASTFLRRKLTSRKTPTRASTLPAALSTSKTSTESSASILLPTNLRENPKKILDEVSDYFSQAAVDQVRSFSEEESMSDSTPTSNSRAQSPLGNTSPSTESSQSPCQEEKPSDVQSQTFPEPLRPIRARSQSEPIHKDNLTPLYSLSTLHPCCSNFELTNSTIKTSINTSSLTPRVFPISISKPSPLSNEIVFKINEINVAPIPRLDRPRIVSGVGTKKKEEKPRSTTQSITNKFEKPTTSLKGDSNVKETLHQGIAAHQKNDLILSAILFERCAKENGGCGVGMLMWALALRHGWGCPVNTTKAFGWLQLGIETLLRELQQTKVEKERYDELHTLRSSPKHLLISHSLLMEVKGITSELLLALYELGQCLMYGWGCERDKKLAVQYYLLAANMGDPDAQKEIAYCYEVGNGVKQSSRNAARYYRMAYAQGVKMMGYQWIWKEKHDPNYVKKSRSPFSLNKKVSVS